MKEFGHYILHEDGRSMYEDEAGNISSTVVPTQLVNVPEGWDQVTIAYQRDLIKMGIMLAFTFPITLVLDGLKIVRNNIYKFGYEFKMFYLIQQRRVEWTDDYFKDYHTKFYRGQIRNSTMQDDEDKMKIQIGPEGLQKAVEAYWDTVYEFPLSDPEASVISHDGMRLYSNVVFEAPAEVEYDSNLFNAEHIIPFGVLNKDGNSFGVAVFDQTIESIKFAVRNDFFQQSQNYFLTVDIASNPVTVRLIGKLIVKCTKRDDAKNVKFRFCSSITGTSMFSIDNVVAVLPGQSAGLNEEVTIPIDVTLQVKPGEHIFLEGAVFGSGTGPGFKYVFMPGSEVTLDFSNRYKTSLVKAFKPAILLDKIIEKVYGKRGKTITHLLSATPYKDLWITSGDGVRGVEKASVKISLSTFFKIYNTDAQAGISVEKGILYMEGFDRYLDLATEPIHLGEVKTAKRSFLQEIMGNTIEIGHKNDDIEGINGKYRFNNIHQYSTIAQEFPKKLSFISPAIADPYIIEFMRTALDGKTTTDSSEDNDIIILHVRETTIEGSKAIASGSGVTLNPSGAIMPFTNFNNIGLTANINRSEFTYFGATTDSRIVLNIMPVSTPTPNQNVTVDLLVNGSIISTVTLLADGIHHSTLTVDRPMSDGEFISVRITSANAQAIVVRDVQLTVEFNTLASAILFRDTYDVIEGVRDATVYNIDLLSPKRLLILWRKYLNSIFYKLDGNLYRFETSDRNPELLTTKNGITIDEDADLPITTDILFKPLVFDVETEVPVDLVDILDSNPYRRFDFEWKGFTYAGFLLKGGIAPNDNKSQVYQLLCDPLTDETKFIE